MGITDSIRLRLQAALSPQQMTTQMSRSTNRAMNDFEHLFGIKYKQTGDLTFKEYDKMMQDSQIKAGYELIRMFLLTRKLIITPASDDPKDKEIADAIEDMFNNMDYPLRKVRNDIYSALPYGYSVGEIIWKYNEDTDLTELKRIRPIPISTLQNCFSYDENGDLDTITQTIEGEDPIPIPAEKCLVYSYDEKFGDRSGRSILDACYDNWYMKQKVLAMWNVFLEKHEGPTLAAFLENQQFKEDAIDGLEQIHEGRANITMGQGDRLEVIESSHRGEGFQTAIEYHDTMIFRKMNIGTMILGQQNGRGAYAQSQTQNDVLNVFLDGVNEDVAAELQIKVQELCDMNWEGITDYPTVSFELFEQKDLLGLIQALEPYVKDLSIDPNSGWFKQLIADVVSRYSDVDTSDLTEEKNDQQPIENIQQPIQQHNQQPTNLPDNGEVTPTPEEQKTSADQANMIGDVNNAFNINKK